MKIITQPSTQLISLMILAGLVFLSFVLNAHAQSVAGESEVPAVTTTSDTSTTSADPANSTVPRLPTPKDRIIEKREDVVNQQADREATQEERRSNIVEKQETKQEDRVMKIEEIQAAQATRQEERQVLRTEKQTTLQGFKQQRIINLSANMSNRMEAVIDRFYKIIERVEQRILKLQQAGVDTAAATSKLREATQTLAGARTMLSDIDTVVYGATTSEKPYTDWQNVKDKYRSIGETIRLAHSQLKEVVVLLKEAIPRREEVKLDRTEEATVDLNPPL